MDNIKQFIISYLEGTISFNEFYSTIKKDLSVLEWLQNIVPKDKKLCKYTMLRDGTLQQETVPFSICGMIDHMLTRIDLVGKLSRECEILCAIERLVKDAFPELVLRSENPIKEKRNFMLDACPEYVLSVEVDESGILDKIFDELPKGVSRTKRIKLFKERIREAFGIEGQSYPRWIQGSEWPLSPTGKPMKYLSSRTIQNKEMVEYVFEDVDTGVKRVIQQIY